MTSMITFEKGARGCGKALSYGLTVLYGRIKTGLVPPLIELSPRTRVLPRHEIAALNSLRLAGLPDAAIREAVLQILDSRAHGLSAPSIVESIVENALAAHRVARGGSAARAVDAAAIAPDTEVRTRKARRVGRTVSP